VEREGLGRQRDHVMVQSAGSDRRLLSLSDYAPVRLVIWPGGFYGGLYERAHIIRYFPHHVVVQQQVEARLLHGEGVVVVLPGHLGLCPTVTSQHSPATLYQVSYHARWLLSLLKWQSDVTR
jgi:hypothetical protein